MKRKRRLVSVVCAAVLALSGLGVPLAGDSALIAHAKEKKEKKDYDLYACITNEDDANIFALGDESHSFTAFLEKEDLITSEYSEVDDSEYSPTYSWELSKDDSPFEIEGSSIGKTVSVKLKDDAKEKLGSDYFLADHLELEATAPGEDIISCELPIYLYSDPQGAANVRIDPEAAVFDENNTYAIFSVSGLNGVDTKLIQWKFDYEYANYFFKIVKNGNNAIVSINKDAADYFDEEMFGDYYSCNLLCRVLSGDMEDRIDVASVPLRYYPGGISYDDLGVEIIDGDGDSVDDAVIWEGESRFLSPHFTDTQMASTLINPVYEWKLSNDIQKFLAINASSIKNSIVIKAKSNALQLLGDELSVDGALTLTVSSDSLEEPLVKEIPIQFAVSSWMDIDDECRLSSQYPTRTLKINKTSGFDLSMLEWELSGDCAEDIFSVSRNGNTITVKLKKNAANIIAEKELEVYSDENNENHYYEGELEFYQRSKSGATRVLLNSVYLDFYLDELYEVTYSPEKLHFVRGKAAEKTITAEVKNIGSKNITYKWTFYEDDPEAAKCFSLTQANSKTVKVRYNGYSSKDEWFALNLQIKVNGKVKPISKTTTITLSDTEEPDDNGGESGSGNGGNQNNPSTVNQNENQNDQTKKPADIGTTINVPGMESYKFVVTSNTEGAATVAFAGLVDKKTKKLKIPSVVTDENGVQYKVTSIPAKAFSGNKKLTKVVIPKTITYIDKKAFYKCSKLKKIVIKADNLTIKGNAFAKLKKGVTITIYAKNKKAFKRMVRKIQKAGAKNATFKFIQS